MQFENYDSYAVERVTLIFNQNKIGSKLKNLNLIIVKQ